MSGWSIRVPASTANLGSGFDVLGASLALYAEIGFGSAPERAHTLDEHHPATVAFARLGGTGALWSRSPIPMGRGLGYSGAMRVGGAAAAVARRDGRAALDSADAREEVYEVAAALEGHADNAAASAFGGVVIAAGGRVTRVPMALHPAVLLWVPATSTTSTDRSRMHLPHTVSRTDAVFNLGRVATFVAACAAGDVEALRTATHDRLHQAARLERQPDSAAALDAMLAAGAWAAWLSGSGPTVAGWCDPARADAIAASLPRSGQTRVVALDDAGVVTVDVA